MTPTLTTPDAIDAPQHPLAVHFSTGKDAWGTPASVFDPLHQEFDFTVDAAANPANHRLPVRFGPGGVAPDALALPDWGDAVSRPVRAWVNPPYSRRLQPRFIAKAAEQAALGHQVVLRLPARTDTVAFHRHIWDARTNRPQAGVDVRFLRGRVRFVGAPQGAPFPSMVVVWWGSTRQEGACSKRFRNSAV